MRRCAASSARPQGFAPRRSPSSTAARVSGTCPVPAASSITARRRRLHLAQRCFSNILSSVPQSAHTLVTGSPAQLAQVSASGPGGLTGRRTWPQRAHRARRRSAAV